MDQTTFRQTHTAGHRVLNVVSDFFRSALGAGAITLTYTYFSITTYAIDPVGAPDTLSVEAVLKQGGLFALILFVLFFYRRDWARLNASQQADRDLLIGIVQSNTRAITELVELVRIVEGKKR